MGEYTPKWGLYKPAIGETGWGDKVNQNFDILDANLFTLKRFIDTLLDPNICFIYKNPPTLADLYVEGTGSAESSDGRFMISIPATAGRYERAVFGTTVIGLRAFTPDGLNTLGQSFDYPIRMFILMQALTSTNTDQIFWIVAGNLATYHLNTSVTTEHIGLKVVNDTLYATVADGSNEYTEILQSPIDSYGFVLELEIKYYPADRVEFSGYYYDGSAGLVQISTTISTNFPSGLSMLYPLYMSVYNGSTAEEKRLMVFRWLFAQAKNADDIM